MRSLGISENIYLYTFIDEFIALSISLLFPLYLLSLGISLSSIGFVVALAPFAFAFLRVFLAETADSGREYSIVKLGAILRSAAAAALLLPMNFFSAAFVNLLAGFAGSPIWTVNRKILYENDTHEKSGKKAAILKNVREAADGLAKLFSLFIVQVAGFFQAFLLVFLSSFLIIIPLKGLSKIKKKAGEQKKPDFRKSLQSLNLGNYGKKFATITLAGCVSLGVDGIIYAFALPIFLKEKVGLAYFELGLYLAFFSLVSFLSTFALIHQKKFQRINFPSAAVFGGFLVLALAVLYIYPNRTGVLVSILLIGISDGVRNIYLEEMVVHAVESERSLKKRQATAIATMGFWAQAAKSLQIIAAGVVAERFGFGAVFLVVSLMQVAYAAFAFRTLSESKSL